MNRHASWLAAALLMVLVSVSIAWGRQDVDGWDEAEIFRQFDAEEQENPFERESTVSQPDITRADVILFARLASLTDDQRRAAIELWETYAARHGRAAERMQEYEDSLTGGDSSRSYDDVLQEKLGPVRSDFYDFEERIEKELMAQVRDLLGEAEAPRMTWFEQRTRLKSEAWGYVLRRAGWTEHISFVDLAGLASSEMGEAPFSDELLEVLRRHYADLMARLDIAEPEIQAATDAFQAVLPQDDAEVDATEEMDEGEDAPLNEATIRAAAELDRVTNQHADAILALVDAGVAKVMPLLPDDVTRERFERRYLLGAAPYGASEWSIIVGPLFRARRAPDLTIEQHAALDALLAELWRASRASAREMLDRAMRDQASAEAPEDDDGDERWNTLGERSRSALNRVREILTVPQMEALGPPILKVPPITLEFDSTDPIPEAELSRATRQGLDFFRSMFGDARVGALDLAYLTRAAGLSPDQREAINDLFEEYRMKERRAIDRFVAYMARQDENGEDEESDTSFFRYEAYRKRIRSELVTDLLTVATEEQAPVMQRFGRRIGRGGLLSMMAGSMVAGSAVDLVRLVSSASGEAGLTDELVQALQRYEEEAGATMDAAQDMLEKLSDQFEQQLEAGKEPDERAMALPMLAAAKQLTEMRQITHRWFQALLPMFTQEEARAEFELAYYSEAGASMFEDMFHEYSGQRGTPEGLRAEILALADLTGDQRASAAVVYRDYIKESVRLKREKYERSLQEEKNEPDPMKRLEGGPQGFDETQWQAQRDATKKALDGLMAVLTGDQKQRLPNPYRVVTDLPRPRFDDD